MIWGPLGFRARPAHRGGATGSMDPKLDLDLDISDLGFDQISRNKRGGCPKWWDGDQFGGKNVRLGVPWGSGPSSPSFGGAVGAVKKSTPSETRGPI